MAAHGTRAPEPPLSRRERLLYASSSLGGEALSRARATWLVFFYAPPADADMDELLPLVLVGAVLVVANLIEALDDALIGHWSDHVRGRWGRRIPFIVTAAPPWALLAVLLFTPPPNASTAVLVAYLFLVYEAHHFFGTMASGPFEAMVAEIARTSAERVRLISARVYFGAAGALVGLVGSGLLVDYAGFAWMATAMAVIALGFRYLGLSGVWGRARRSHPAPERVSVRAGLRATFANRNFQLFLPTFVLFQAGLTLMLGALPFYASAIIGTNAEGTWVAIMTGVAIGVMLLCVPFYARFARRHSTRGAYRRAMLLAALAFPLLALPGLLPGIPVEAQVIAVMVIAGVPIAGVFLFPAALTADIIDDETARIGLRREASYYGAQNLVEKLAGSLAPLLLAGVLLLGNTADDPTGVRLIGPVAGLLVLAAWFVFRGYDLPDDPAEV